MIHNFPEDIKHDILFRLPLKSLIRCTSVCKPWRSIIKNPSFIRGHLKRTINFNNLHGTHLLLLHCVPRAIISSGIHNPRIDEPTEEHYCLHYDNHAFDKYCKIQCPVVPEEELYNSFLRVVGSYNGLVFLADDKDRLGYTFIICNPSIRKSVTLPKPHLTFETIGPYYACIGFGFDATANDYKVVRLITDQCDNPTFFEVYSLARGSWSSPSHFDPVCEVSDPRKPQAFVNGAIHWLAWNRLSDGSAQTFILKFDVGSELFCKIMVPKSLIGESSWKWELSVTGDRKSIALFAIHGDFFMDSSLDIWVMREYGRDESWSEVITLSPQGPQSRLRSKALCFRKSGEVVLVKKTGDGYGYNEKHELISLDLMSREFKNLGIHDYKYYYADSYEESLVLLDKSDAVSY